MSGKLYGSNTSCVVSLKLNLFPSPLSGQLDHRVEAYQIDIFFLCDLIVCCVLLLFAENHILHGGGLNFHDRAA